MSYQEGKSFKESFEIYKNNPMMWGLPLGMAGFGIGMETRSMMRGLKNVDLNSLPNQQLHGLNQSMNSMQTSRVQIENDLKLLGKNWDDIKNIDDIGKQLPADRQAKFRENFEKYVEGQKDIKNLIDSYDSEIASDAKIGKAVNSIKYIESVEVQNKMKNIFEGTGISEEIQGNFLNHIRRYALEQQITNPGRFKY